MRITVLVFALLLGAVAIEREAAFAASAAPQQSAPAVQPQAQEIDDNDDTRVEVQLVVLGIVIATVFVFGTALYFVRRRLGLVPPPPEQSGDGHH